MAKSRRNKLVTPFVKWVGGKRQIMSSIVSFFPNNIEEYKYIEPFLGGGAVFFHLQPKNAIISDSNEELINTYKVIKNNLEELLVDLKKHKNNADYFYEIRALDRDDNYKNLSDIERASRLLYLNKTCFNGLYRVNNAGEFNTPFGNYKRPNIVNEPVLKAVSNYLNSSENIQILNADYLEVFANAAQNSFLYLDPPYHPISSSSNFTGYVQGGFTLDDQINLKNACDALNERGVKFLQSNSSSHVILDLYKGYKIEFLKAKRAINSVGTKRGDVDEVIIRNYE